MSLSKPAESTHASAHPINTSKAKQLYSFPKSKRFPNTRLPPYSSYTFDGSLIFSCSCHQGFYNLPSAYPSRTTGFGFGDRFKDRLSKLSVFDFAAESPAPGSYETKTQFRVDNHARAFSFGVSRDSVAKVYLEHKVPVDGCSPGPSFYPVPKPTSSQSFSYSMRPKNSSSSKSLSISVDLLMPPLGLAVKQRLLPGPG